MDLGAGTGVFCKVFHHLGVPGDKLIAVDIENPTHRGINAKEFWHIHRDNNFKPNPQDILFIAWGTTGIDNIVEDYVGETPIAPLLILKKGELTGSPRGS